MHALMSVIVLGVIYIRTYVLNVGKHMHFCMEKNFLVCMNPFLGFHELGEPDVNNANWNSLSCLGLCSSWL